MRTDERYGKFFTVERISDVVALYFFDRKEHVIDYEDIAELSTSLSLATCNAVTIMPDEALFYRGILVIFRNPLISKCYVAELVDECVTNFFAERRKDPDDYCDNNESEYIPG